MKGWTVLFALAATALLTAACARTQSAAGVSVQQAGSGAASGAMSAVSTVSAPGPLSDQEILDAYDRAAEAYDWFSGETLPCGGQAVNADGGVYQRVDDPGLETLEDLRTYLGGFFSAEVTEELLARGGDAPLYRDVDGALYARTDVQPQKRRVGGVTLSVERIDEKKYQVNAAVDRLDEDQSTVTGVDCYAFPYEMADGRWVFTDFDAVS
jgi:predicted small secreted protein